MKLRIRGNSVRMRVTKSEVEKLRSGGTISESTDFGTGEAKFRYELSVGAVHVPQAEFQDNCVRVLIPEDGARVCMDSENVSIESMQPIGDNRFLTILVEKDFACLMPREGEEDVDAFPNPSETVSC